MASNLERRQVAADLQLIVGGNFTADALGPLYQQTIDRVRAAPSEYLKEFTASYLSRPLELALHSRLYLANVLRILADLQPTSVKTIARTLLQQINTAMAARSAGGAGANEAVSDDTLQMLQSVDMRKRELQSLLRT